MTGINTIPNNDLTISVFPNPFSHSATIHIEENIHNNLDLVLYNEMGRVAKNINGIKGSGFVLSKGNLASGLYFYSITSAGRIVARGKIMIE